jgi:PAS domain S-box-containing protein
MKSNPAKRDVGASRSESMMGAARDLWTSPHLLETSFRHVLESTPDAMLLVNAAGRIVMVNRQTEVLFGYPRQELLGEPVEILMPERFRQAHGQHRVGYAHHPHTRAMGVGLELYGLRRDGSEFPVEISLSPIETGESTLVMSAIRDVSDRKRIEQELREKNEELQLANQELEAFSYSISHDLRAPVRAMRGFAQLLADELPEPMSADVRRALQRIEESANRMSLLIDGLLSLARFARQSITRTQVNPAHIARAVIQDLRPELDGRAVDIKIGKLPVCEADPTLLRQVFANLLSNAFKYSRNCDPALIRISAVQSDGASVYRIQDNGVGFDMRHAGKLFRVFQRLHHADQFEGIGVGLALVQQIVQRHGGRIWAEAKPEQGASFFFTLAPSQAVPRPSATRRSRSIAPGRARREPRSLAHQ